MSKFTPFITEYLEHQASVVVLQISKTGIIEHANQFARDLAGRDLTGNRIEDYFTGFNEGFNISTLIHEQVSRMMLNVNTYQGLPETLYFTSCITDDGCLLIGETNNLEVQELKKTMITLNNELNNLTRELQKKNIQLDQLNKLKNQFLGMAAHDLRNPIGSIMMFAEFILDEQGSSITDELRQIMEMIRNSSKFMLHLLDELLDVVKIESGKLELKFEKVVLADFLQRNVAVNSILATKKQINIVLQVPEKLPEISFDASKIEQVMNNLISNAIKFSHTNTTISIGAFNTGNEVIISVSDQGQGIPKNEIDKVFTPFTKLSVRGTAGEKSTGLGLSIAKRIIIGHQGRIWLDSTVGVGTTFFFTLPISTNQ